MVGKITCQRSNRVDMEITHIEEKHFDGSLLIDQLLKDIIVIGLCGEYVELFRRNEVLINIGQETNRPDIEGVGRIYVQTQLDLQSWSHLQAKFSHPQSRFFVGLVEGTIVGSVAIRHVSDSEAELVRMTVSKEHRRRGFGLQLVNHLLKYAASCSYSSVFLSTPTINEGAIAMYNKAGFVFSTIMVVPADDGFVKDHQLSLTFLRHGLQPQRTEQHFPVIDVGSLMVEAPSLEDKRRVGDAIKEALETSGFFLVSNHGCQSQLVREAMEKFFKLEEEEKGKIQINGFRGWSNLGSEVTRGKKDWHECIEFLGEYDRVRIINGVSTNIFNSKNQWPEVAGVDFQAVVDDYISKISKVGQAIIEAIAASYNLPLHGFDGFAEDPFYILRLLYYPVMPPSATSDGAVGIGVGEHTDYGCLTLIHTLQEGLEIKPTPDSDWMGVPVMGDCLVCNIGDMLSYWTRHILKATPHRVRRVQKERLSIAFFFEPSPDTVIRPLESLRGHPLADPSTGDSPVLYGEYLQGKYESSYPTFTPDGAPPGN